MTFRIKTIAQESEKAKPRIITEEYSGASVDLRCSQIIKNLIFFHGFKKVKLIVTRVDEFRVLHQQEVITIELNGRTRR